MKIRFIVRSEEDFSRPGRQAFERVLAFQRWDSCSEPQLGLSRCVQSAVDFWSRWGCVAIAQGLGSAINIVARQPCRTLNAGCVDEIDAPELRARRETEQRTQAFPRPRTR